MGKNLVIYYNDSIDSDNLAAAMALWKATCRRPNTRLMWIIEPRQVGFGLSMTAEQVSKCQELIKQHFESLGNPSKVLLGGLINQVDLDDIQGLTEGDRHILQMAVKPKYGSKDDAVRHGHLAALDFASSLAKLSKDSSFEVFVDFESLDEIENPVNLHPHHHEELYNREPDELRAYNDIMENPPAERTQSLRDWCHGCAERIERKMRNSKTSVKPLDLDALCQLIDTAPKVEFFGGSSLRILSQFLEKGVAGKIECHLQVGSCDMSANLFANQFNIALNPEAAKTVLSRSTEFLKFTVVPSHVAQGIRYPVLGLTNAGGPCLEKRILGFNCREDPLMIATSHISSDNQRPFNQHLQKAYTMPDLTAFLCTLIPDDLGSKLEFVEVEEDSNGTILFKPSNKGIRMYSLGEPKTFMLDEIFEKMATGEVPHEQPRHGNGVLEGN